MGWQSSYRLSCPSSKVLVFHFFIRSHRHEQRVFCAWGVFSTGTWVRKCRVFLGLLVLFCFVGWRPFFQNHCSNLSGIRCPPVCGIFQPSLALKPSSKHSFFFFNRHFQKSRRTVVCVCVCRFISAYIFASMACAIALSCLDGKICAIQEPSIHSSFSSLDCVHLKKTFFLSKWCKMTLTLSNRR